MKNKHNIKEIVEQQRERLKAKMPEPQIWQPFIKLAWNKELKEELEWLEEKLVASNIDMLDDLVERCNREESSVESIVSMLKQEIEECKKLCQ